MPRAAELALPPLADALCQATTDNVWRHRLQRLREAAAQRLHLAIMHEPFLSLLLDGTKTIESRFTVNRIAPYQQAQPGDVLALKKPAGPVVGLALVSAVRFLEVDPGKPDQLLAVRRQHGQAIAATDDEFWAARTEKRYASLLSVIHPIPAVTTGGGLAWW
jgi:hypothetical protein